MDPPSGVFGLRESIQGMFVASENLSMALSSLLGLGSITSVMWSCLWGLFNLTRIIFALFIISLRVGALLSQVMLMTSLSLKTILLVLFRWSVASGCLSTWWIWVSFVTFLVLRLLGLDKAYIYLIGSILSTFFRIQVCMGVDLPLHLWSQILGYQQRQGTITRSVYLSVACGLPHLFDEHKAWSHVCC